MSVRPIFLLSLPRSGSTLVQRVLAVHEDVSTAPEPWILLPQLYAFRERGMYAEYGQIPSSRAVREFAARLPRGEEDYRAELRQFVLRLYARASAVGTRYFVDKTPRYHLIVNELFELFPEGRFVFLWRNPLAVASSISETWGKGAWNVEKYRVDLYDGVANLVAGYRAHGDQAFAVRYEDLVTDPERAWPPLFEYLELPFDPAVLEDFGSVNLEARMGDPTGSKSYGTLSTEPLDKWRTTLEGSVRKRWCAAWLRWIGEERLGAMGYRLADLIGDLRSVPGRPGRLGSDLARTLYGSITRRGRRAAGRRLRPAGD